MNYIGENYFQIILCYYNIHYKRIIYMPYHIIINSNMPTVPVKSLHVHFSCTLQLNGCHAGYIDLFTTYSIKSPC